MVRGGMSAGTSPSGGSRPPRASRPQTSLGTHRMGAFLALIYRLCSIAIASLFFFRRSGFRVGGHDPKTSLGTHRISSFLSLIYRLFFISIMLVFLGGGIGLRIGVTTPKRVWEPIKQVRSLVESIIFHID